MEIFIGKDEGEWPKGTRVGKVRSAPGDFHPDGAQGTIVGALGPVPDDKRAEIILAAAKIGINEDILFLYWVEWDDLPGVPVAITDYRLERLE